MFIAVDKKKIFCGEKERVIKDYPSIGIEFEDGKFYILKGGITGAFKVPIERCVEIDNEYAIQANLYGIRNANEWAKEKGYIE